MSLLGGRSRERPALAAALCTLLAGTGLLSIGFGLGQLSLSLADDVVTASTTSGPEDAPPLRSAPVETALPTSVAVAPVVAAELQISTLDLRSQIGELDLRGDGALIPPTPADEIGWYRGSAVPGEPGPAVIVGHVNSRRGPGLLSRIEDLRPGTEVRVIRSDAQPVTYRVYWVERFAKHGFPTEAVYRPTPEPELRLITCGGAFDPVRRSYEDNVIVFAATDR